MFGGVGRLCRAARRPDGHHRGGQHGGDARFVDHYYFPRRERCACCQNGSPAKNVAPAAMTPTAASTLLRPSSAQYTSSRSSNSASSSTTSAVADPYAIATAG